MKKPLLILTLLSASLLCSAQSISNSNLGFAGKTMTSGDVNLSFSAGEPVIGLMGNEQVQLGSGFFPSYNSELLATTSVNKDSNFNVWPNPVQDILNVSNPEMNQLTVRIYSITGQALTQLTTTDKIDVSWLTAGIYIINIKTDKTENSYKITKF